MPKSIIYNRFKIVGHILFWLTSISIFSIIFSVYEENISIYIIEKAVVTNIGFALAVYINLYVLIPHFLKQKNYIFFIFWLIILLTSASLIIQFLFIYPLRSALKVTDALWKFNTNLHSAYFFATLLYVGITSFLKFVKDWISLQDLNLKLARIEQQKLEAELKTLKGQLNPHFLFNSLNNIYSLSLIKSEKVPDLILKLSDLMRHIIYESRENFIALEKEIEFVDNFISLQKIRTSSNKRIDYKITGEIPSAKIAPLLFEPFIDNAFKHGLPGSEKDDFISIKLNFNKPTQLEFLIENNYIKGEHLNKKNSGIGIENVKKRLKLLYKPDEYRLKIKKENQTYSVELWLKLKMI